VEPALSGTSALVSAARKVLDRNAVQFVVVGGQALYLRVHTSTSDADVIVATPEYEEAVRRLSSDPDVEGSDSQGGTSFIHLKSAGGARLDILDAANYSGNRPGAEFISIPPLFRKHTRGQAASTLDARSSWRLVRSFTPATPS
jgi:hypothetical protein